ncbi:heme A synthase [Gulosibacter sp. 10]|uniref:COX15/CtaA family protein n=1 Tax=Gulosibacter sp. 10 TaxID=1255570 RepID=UPI00097EDC1A|nr:COX15/CtaA family protein [Gulosibacter sp. 10]SJM53253.1 Cytochrome oxidase assembly protein [Gulosibacter sp. 10]
MSFIARLMPDRVTVWTRFAAWLNLVLNILIVATGGLVRLTGSGLGCPTWPMCTDESLVPTSEMGVHGVIEFGNRTLTGALAIAALLVFLAVINTRGSGLGLVGPAVWIGSLVVVQAVIGGITVLVDLDPRVVGVHFLFSVSLAGICALLLQRVRLNEPLPAAGAASADRLLWASLMAVAVLTWITEIVGVLTTGAGPHAGDTAAARNGLDPQVMQHVHSWPGYALAVALLVLLVLLFRSGSARSRSLGVSLTLLVIVQIAVGVYQSRMGLPIWSVAVHMVLAVVAVAVLTVLIVNVRRDGAAKRSGDGERRPDSGARVPVGA